METTAVALTTLTAAGQPLAGVIAYLRSPALPGGFLFAITNTKGYALWPSVPVPFSGVLQLAGAAQWYGDPDDGQAVSIPAAQNLTIRVGGGGHNPQDLLLPACLPFRKPFRAAPRVWKGNFCGVHVAGLPSVPGGSSDPTLVFSPFLDRYAAEDRARILQAFHDRGDTHVLLSWPDSRSVGQSPQQFLATCQDVLDADLFPCVMLSAKEYDPPDVAGVLANIAPVLPLLVGVVPLFCIGWELSLWLSPAQVQALIDALAPQWLAQPGTRGYVHFQAGYFAYQPNGQQTGAFWAANVGKLHGLLHQRNFDDSPDFSSYQARIVDCLQRFAGQFNCPADSGFGVGAFDFIALEITAMLAFFNGMSEADQNAWGQAAITTPPVAGPFGPVAVMGSGNGS